MSSECPTPKKRRFWKTAAFVSGAFAFLVAILGYTVLILSTGMAYANVFGKDIDLEAIPKTINFGIASWKGSLIIGGLALLFCIIAIIRYRNLPKPI